MTVRDILADDRDAWLPLFRGYAEFYEVTLTESSIATTWGWIVDPQHPVSALVVEDDGGRLIGFAHYRAFPDPLEGTIGCFLDDLFVAPDARGGGAARALLAELRARAATNGWSVVRWITAESNSTARRLYDRVAERTMWVTYDMTPR